MESLFSLDGLAALLTLTAMETVLGIDNVVFIAILVEKLPEAQREKARNLGLMLALFIRIGLLFSISWLMGLTEPLFALLNHSFSGRDLILCLGGLFLLGKSTFEIHEKLEASPKEMKAITGGSNAPTHAARNAFFRIIFQILILDIVFSLDSVITAVGMANEISIMVIAMVIAMAIMLFSAKMIGEFVNRHPTIKILALSFLLMIGVMLVGEGMGQHIEKGYIYFAMAFSLGIEVLNMRYRKIHSPVKLHEPQSVLSSPSMKNISLLLFLSLLSFASFPASANPLLEGVDQMTPKDAYLFQQKLQAKTAEPIPQSFWTNAVVSFSSSTVYSIETDAQKLPLGRPDRAYGFQGALLWKTCDCFALGLGFGFLGQSSEREIYPGTLYEQFNLNAFYMHLAAQAKFNVGPFWSIVPSVGIGAAQFGVNWEQTNDSTSSTYRRKYSALGPSAQASLGVLYAVNNVWNIGLEGGYFYALATKVERAKAEVGAPGEVGVIGAFAGMKMTFNW